MLRGMAETENTSEISLLTKHVAALERELGARLMAVEKQQRAHNKVLDAVGSSLVTITEGLAEILPLVHRAAPLLDSPMAKLAASPRLAASPATLAAMWKGARNGR